jgi:hypothetical protein
VGVKFFSDIKGIIQIVPENRILRRIFRAKLDEMIGG